jgi:hypothetical protein
MQDGLPASYDAWRTSNAEDEADEREQRRLHDEDRADKADYERDSRRDECR